MSPSHITFLLLFVGTIGLEINSVESCFTALSTIIRNLASTWFNYSSTGPQNYVVNIDEPVVSGGNSVTNRTTRNYVARCTMVFRSTTTTTTKTCAGAVVKNDTIAFSAHCTHYTSTDLSNPVVTSCTLGDLNVDVPNEQNEITINENISITRHPNYNAVTRQFDIAKIVFFPALNLSRNSAIQPIRTSNNISINSFGNGTNVDITGWGTNAVYKITTEIQGDDGAPLVTSINGIGDTLVGITSFFGEQVVYSASSQQRTERGFKSNNVVTGVLSCDFNIPAVAVFITDAVQAWLIA
ncbi:unnamed protein product [Notodromas monacha]|uniref:Peptidase S1 domain-containing protein n=1 Tax=Notodromas monacha TaxID=399045 RepID=A0A7R9GEY5_9CRUS|nr:unnamed protein product [Notodromas monacha]CAG0918561.1 unnamed protein product [Notodromas monacha]